MILHKRIPAPHNHLTDSHGHSSWWAFLRYLMLQQSSLLLRYGKDPGWRCVGWAGSDWQLGDAMLCFWVWLTCTCLSSKTSLPFTPQFPFLSIKAMRGEISLSGLSLLLDRQERQLRELGAKTCCVNWTARATIAQVDQKYLFYMYCWVQHHKIRVDRLPWS